MGLLKMLDDFLERRQKRKEKEIFKTEYKSIMEDARRYVNEPLKTKKAYGQQFNKLNLDNARKH